MYKIVKIRPEYMCIAVLSQHTVTDAQQYRLYPISLSVLCVHLNTLLISVYFDQKVAKVVLSLPIVPSSVKVEWLSDVCLYLEMPSVDVSTLLC